MKIGGLIICFVLMYTSFSFAQKPFGFGQTEAEIRDSKRADPYFAFWHKGTTSNGGMFIAYKITSGSGYVTYHFNDNDVCWMYTVTSDIIQLNFARKELEKNFDRINDETWISKDLFTAASIKISEEKKQFTIIYVDKTP